MKTLSVIQPWAQLIADGRKQYETRGWSPRFTLLKPGDLLAIAASKSWTLPDRELAEEWGYDLGAMPLGCIVAVVRFQGAFATGSLDISDEERGYGDFTPGRYAWRLELVQKLETPIECRGALGLWEFPSRLLTEVTA